MEAVAAVSSIAGILSLVGQALNGIVTLRGFYQDCAAASQSIQRFLKRLNELIQILEDVKELMSKLEQSSSKAVSDNVLASLRIQIEDCSNVVYKWLEVARNSMPGSSSRTKSSFNQFLIALEKRKIMDIYVEIAAHKDNIVTKLSFLGRCFDIDHSATLLDLSTKMDIWPRWPALDSAFVQSDAETQAQVPQIAEWANWQESENRMILDVSGQGAAASAGSNRDYSNPGSAASLASIAGSLSRIESKMDTFENFIGREGSRDGSNAGSVSSAVPASPYLPPYIPQNSRPADTSSFGAYKPRNAREVLSFSEREARLSQAAFREKLRDKTKSIEDKLHALQSMERIRTEKQLQSSVRSESKNLSARDTSNDEDDLEDKSNSYDEDVRHDAVKYGLRSSHSFSLQRSQARSFTHLPTKYLDLSILAAMVKMKIHILESAPSILLGASEATVKEEINLLNAELSTLNTKAKEAQISSFESGFNTQDLDHYMFQCLNSVPEPLLRNSSSHDHFPKHETAVSAPTVTDTTKHDRINMWLLGNLQASSDEKKRHRALLNNVEDLSEEQWARLVLRYWLLDEAATCVDDKPASTNGAVNSAGMCHSARVMFDSITKPILEEVVAGAAGREPLLECVVANKMDIDKVSPSGLPQIRRNLSLRHKKRKYSESV